jgi:hypothetical protein
MSSSCTECQAIAVQLRDAYFDAWASADRKTQDAWLAAHKLMGGTEDDAERAEELLGSYRLGENHRTEGLTRAGQALIKKLIHEARTGHKIQAQTSS